MKRAVEGRGCCGVAWVHDWGVGRWGVGERGREGAKAVVGVVL